MARCNICGEDDLIWKQVQNKWRLHGGMNRNRVTGIHDCSGKPVMGGRKKVDKDFESRKMKVIGFCFNKRNLDEGLLDAILKGNIRYDDTD